MIVLLSKLHLGFNYCTTIQTLESAWLCICSRARYTARGQILQVWHQISDVFQVLFFDTM